MISLYERVFYYYCLEILVNKTWIIVRRFADGDSAVKHALTYNRLIWRVRRGKRIIARHAIS